ncbi:MAG: glycosyltransferase family 2 protein [Nitrospinota bacterium]|nr:glycosyltransferase family 2 protein [Nitrospinota bacterium]
MSQHCTDKRIVIIPVFNEEPYISNVIRTIKRYYDGDILIINDGSTDGTSEIIANLKGVRVLSHKTNMGYGKSLIDGFSYAAENGYSCVVTIDCDEQHEPHHIPTIFRDMGDLDVFSASRYLKVMENNDEPPPDRYRINRVITENVNRITGYKLTDGFCGMKGYKVKSLVKMDLREHGYAFPIEFWIQAFHLGFKVGEFPIARIYKNLNRSFGAQMDDPDRRLDFYMKVLEREMNRWQISSPLAPTRTI